MISRERNRAGKAQCERLVPSCTCLNIFRDDEASPAHLDASEQSGSVPDGSSSRGPNVTGLAVLDEEVTQQGNFPPRAAMDARDLGVSGAIDADQPTGESSIPTIISDFHVEPDRSHRVSGNVNSISLNVADHLDPMLPDRELDSIAETSHETHLSRDTTFSGSQDDLRTPMVQ